MFKGLGSMGSLAGNFLGGKNPLTSIAGGLLGGEEKTE
jgi:hypothetical protein